MKISTLNVIVCLAGLLAAQDVWADDLPREAAQILERLQQAETQIQAKADAQIREKRQAVGKILEQHASRETRAGNLTAAVELKKMAAKFQDSGEEKPQRGRLPGFIPNSGSMKVKIQIDGTSWMLVSKTHLWLSHDRGIGAPAGRHGGEYPTTIDSTEWMPEWQGKITERWEMPEPMPVDSGRFELRARLRSGRGMVEVEQQPSKENGYIAKIRMSDEREGRRFSGSDWMEFRLTW